MKAREEIGCVDGVDCECRPPLLSILDRGDMVLPPKQFPELAVILGDFPEMVYKGHKHSRRAVFDCYAVLLKPHRIKTL